MTAEAVTERMRRLVAEVLLLPHDEARAVLDAMAATVRSASPRLGTVVRVQGRESIVEALELLLKQYQAGDVCGFSCYADVDGAGRFSSVYAPAGGAVGDDELP